MTVCSHADTPRSYDPVPVRRGNKTTQKPPSDPTLDAPIGPGSDSFGLKTTRKPITGSQLSFSHGLVAVYDFSVCFWYHKPTRLNSAQWCSPVQTSGPCRELGYKDLSRHGIVWLEKVIRKVALQALIMQSSSHLQDRHWLGSSSASDIFHGRQRALVATVGEQLHQHNESLGAPT
ncbi:hypothetical protein HBI37_130940 [Parastagonospora nodorum]|nr:hypothetical protein HBI11_061650 [Parastagonospora nodorum]KAH5459863.1 hypothetical protein HBI30_045180 [Parastagonospora nodorum]KAH6034810.1 hypothetical protein HBI83_006370 [Parastagonospora nodorum]KAH6217662.1 hypothetical protein HBI43_120080 [Parastagonospora nodorum]KAH6256085.1 hypothetical protein HBI42_120660 [Parastagonospora nodorum]